MRYEAPVVCSNVTSLPETIVKLEFVFNPYDAADISDKIFKGLFDKKFREENLANSKERMAYYTKIESINDFTNAYKTAINKFHKK